MAYNSIDRIPRDDVQYWLADRASTHRNLVDNPFFTINSRQVDEVVGVTAPGVNTFCVDRWKFNRGVVKTLSGGGINYTNTDSARFKRLFQSITEKPTASDELTVTMHCKVNNNSGAWYLSTFGADASQSDQTRNIILIPTTAGEYWIEKTFSVPISYSGINPFGVGLFNAVENATIDIDIYAIKLERGNYSTLKMDYQPNYYLELIKCKTATVDSNDTEANKTLTFI